MHMKLDLCAASMISAADLTVDCQHTYADPQEQDSEGSSRGWAGADQPDLPATGPADSHARARLQVRAEGGAEGLALAGLELHAVQLLDRLCKRCTGCLLRQAPIGGLLLYRQTAPLLYLFVRT